MTILSSFIIQVDVDECPQTANDNKVQAMPTFMFFKNGYVPIDICVFKKNDVVLSRTLETFIYLFIRSFFPSSRRQKIDSIRGADPQALEDKIRELGGDKAKMESFSGSGQTLGGGGGGPPQPRPWERSLEIFLIQRKCYGRKIL